MHNAGTGSQEPEAETQLFNSLFVNVILSGAVAQQNYSEGAQKNFKV